MVNAARGGVGRCRLTQAVTLACLLGIVAPASATPAWRPAVKVEPAPSASSLSFPRVAARPEGCTTVAFERGDTVFASTRAPGGSFSPVQNLGSILPAPIPEIAAGGGVAAAAWPSSTSRIQVAMGSGCDPLGVPAEVPGSYTLANQGAFPAVDSAGTAVVAFEAGASGSRRVYVSERAVGGSPSSAAPLPVSVGTEVFRPKVTANGDGAAIVFDIVATGGSDVYGALRTGPATWSTPVRLNEAGKPSVSGSARVVVGSEGSLHAVWIDASNSKLIFVTLEPGGAPARTTLHEVAGGNIATDPAAPAIAADAAGRIAVAWTQVVAGVRTVKAKLREPGGAFSGVMDVSPTSNEPRGNPLLAIDRHGRTVATWSTSPAIGTQQAVGAIRDAGASKFSGQSHLADPKHVTSPAGISTDGAGNTLVSVYRTESPREALVAAFDAAGPLLREVSIPASGTAGDALPFSVAPLDAWSATSPASWTFGDGGTASGDAVSRAYGTGGNFGVGITVADELGNASTAGGVVSVGPGPGPRDEIGVPRLSRLSLSRAIFAVEVGSRVRFTLSERARVRFAIKPRRTRATTSAATVRKGSFRRRGKQGRNDFFFAGRLRGKPLAPGRYRLRAVAVDPDGNRSQPKSVAFTITG